MNYIRAFIITLLVLLVPTGISAQETNENKSQQGIAQIEYSTKAELDTIIGSAALAFE